MRFSLLCFLSLTCLAQSYPPAAGEAGSTAIPKESPNFVAWATEISVERGYVNISNPTLTAAGSNFASAGLPEYATGFPDGNTVSLGDGGFAIATFDSAVRNDEGFDFAVFENGSTAYLELAFVEVSSDGQHFFRFPNHSQTETATQIGSFGTPSAPYLNNLAGKYAALYGTPFDLSDLPDDALLDKNSITHVKIIDVVGSINPDFASQDSFGNAVNDSFPTPFNSCGFDLQAVGVIHQQSLGVNDQDLSEVSVYPNPTSGEIHVNSDENCVFSIFALDGKMVVAPQKISGNTIDLTHLPIGIYLAKIKIGEKTKVVKVMKK
ncbi:T9SS type A sorting domain-containing protein [Flavobacterium sp.]|uniref:T9SS type A sorting domain-containing protein n=1 Tax=Flavobacterium sp. TaxID=239 RepID=UPI0011FAD6D5|nr:T9SS type A sorting domain-containing protein [Flavobacterium sp.]RZJ71375.1 MAG: T9SS type A sorting domain-containing protein [Flavobacterium sp.]